MGMVYRVLLPFEQQPQQPQVQQHNIQYSALIPKSFLLSLGGSRHRNRVLFQPIITLISPPGPTTTAPLEDGGKRFRLQLRISAGRREKPPPHVPTTGETSLVGRQARKEPDAAPASHSSRLPDSGSGITPSRTALGIASMPGTDQVGGPSPTAHFATRQALNSPPVLTGHGETLRPHSTATAATGRSKPTPLPPPEPSEAPPAAAAPYAISLVADVTAPRGPGPISCTRAAAGRPVGGSAARVGRCVRPGLGSEGEVWGVWRYSLGPVAKRAPEELLRAGRAEGYAAEELLRGYRRLRRRYLLPLTDSPLVPRLFRSAHADDLTGRAAEAARREPAGLAASPGCRCALLTPPSSQGRGRGRAPLPGDRHVPAGPSHCAAQCAPPGQGRRHRLWRGGP